MFTSTKTRPFTRNHFTSPETPPPTPPHYARGMACDFHGIQHTQPGPISTEEKGRRICPPPTHAPPSPTNKRHLRSSDLSLSPTVPEHHPPCSPYSRYIPNNDRQHPVHYDGMRRRVDSPIRSDLRGATPPLGPGDLHQGRGTQDLELVRRRQLAPPYPNGQGVGQALSALPPVGPPKNTAQPPLPPFDTIVPSSSPNKRTPHTVEPPYAVHSPTPPDSTYTYHQPDWLKDESSLRKTD